MFSKLLICLNCSLIAWIILSQSSFFLSISAQQREENSKIMESVVKAPFRVVGEDGETLLHVKKTGKDVILSISSGNQEVLSLGGTKDGSYIQLNTPGQQNASIFISADSDNRFLRMSKGSHTFQITNSDNGSHFMMKAPNSSILMHQDDKSSGFSVDSLGSGGFMLNASDGESDFFLSGADGKPRMHFEGRWGVSSLNVYSPFPGRGSISLFANSRGPRLAFRDVKGKPVMELPDQEPQQ